MENKELELLREHFELITTEPIINHGLVKELSEQIQEIQKQSKLKRKIDNFKLDLFPRQTEIEFDEILKELGYEC